MLIKLDFRAHTPIYVQIVDQLLGHVETGRLKKEKQLPTVRRLAEDLKVNFNTVARAYRILDKQGVISTQHGRGTFVIGMPKRRKKTERGASEIQRKALAFMAEVHQKGFRPKEVEREITKLLKRWGETGSPTGH
jgi:GntR family transcriptional regulator